MSQYLYGLVPAASAPPDTPGVDGAPVEVWALDETVGVLRSPTDRARVQPRRAHLTAHDRVLAEAMATGPVLPLRFGIIVADVDGHQVLEDLDLRAVETRWQLLDGRTEVQLLWDLDEDMGLQRVAHEVPQVRDAALPAIDRGRVVAEAMADLAIADLDRVVDRLGEHVVARRTPESRGTAGARAAVLVERDDVDALVDDCDALAVEVGAAGTLRHVAGLPPYSFADLHDDVPVEVG